MIQRQLLKKLQIGLKLILRVAGFEVSAGKIIHPEIKTSEYRCFICGGFFLVLKFREEVHCFLFRTQVSEEDSC